MEVESFSKKMMLIQKLHFSSFHYMDKKAKDLRNIKKSLESAEPMYWIRFALKLVKVKYQHLKQTKGLKQSSMFFNSL